MVVIINRHYHKTLYNIWVRSWNFGCLVTWFCYQLIAKPGNKTATVSWPDPSLHWHGTSSWNLSSWKLKMCSPYISLPWLLVTWQCKRTGHHQSFASYDLCTAQRGLLWYILKFRTQIFNGFITVRRELWQQIMRMVLTNSQLILINPDYYRNIMQERAICPCQNHLCWITNHHKDIRGWVFFKCTMQVYALPQWTILMLAPMRRQVCDIATHATAWCTVNFTHPTVRGNHNRLAPKLHAVTLWLSSKLQRQLATMCTPNCKYVFP